MKSATKTGFFQKRAWYHPLGLARRLINYYLLICISLFFLQNSLLFPRYLTGAVMSPGEAAHRAAEQGLVPWSGGSAAAKLNGFVADRFEQPTPRGTIVVFHGNAGCAFDRRNYVDAFARRGFRTFLYEYPGYGGREGSPSAATIIEDARGVIRSLDKAGLGPIYVWGESVGAGVAALVCRDATLPVRGLILLTPWDSLTNAAAYHYPFVPVSILLWDKYDSIANLAAFAHPICVICSANDEVLPARLGLHLFESLGGAKKLIVQPDCGHNDWPSQPELSWWDDALDFIAPRNS